MTQTDGATLPAGGGDASLMPPEAQDSGRCLLFFCAADAGLKQGEAAKRAERALQAAGLDEQSQAELAQGFAAQMLEARLRACGGSLLEAPVLGRLLRQRIGALLSSSESPAEVATLALAARRLPPWALESEDERSARLAAENTAVVEAARNRGSRQPGARAREGAGSHSRGGGEWEDQPRQWRLPRSGKPQHPASLFKGAREAVDEDQDELAAWSDEQWEREEAELAELWRGHNPKLADKVDARSKGVDHYLRLCRELPPVDVTLLDLDVFPLRPNDDLRHCTLEQLKQRVIRLWNCVASGDPAPGGGPWRRWRDGRCFSREDAEDRLDELLG